MAGYSDDATLQAWLDAYGYELPDGAPSLPVLRQRGSAYIDATYGARFKGLPTGGFEQERAWPRTGAVVNGFTIPSDMVPLAVIHASFMAAWQEANEPGSLSSGPSSAASTIKRERVEGAVEVEYQSAAKSAPNVPYDPYAPSAQTVTIPAIDGLLAPYLVLPVHRIGILSVGC